MLVDSVSCIVILFQIIGILISDKVSISVIEFGSLIIGFVTSLVVVYKTVLIVCRIQFLIERTIVIVHQNIIIHILTIFVLVYGTLLMAFFSGSRVPCSGNVTGFAVLVVRLFFIRNVMSGVIGNIHNLILMISVYVFSQSCNSGGGNLVSCDNVSKLISVDVDSPYKDSFASVRFFFRNVCHTCIWVYLGISVSISVKMIYHCAFSNRYGLIDSGIADFIEVSTNKFQVWDSTLECIDGILCICLWMILLVRFQYINGYLIMVFIVSVLDFLAIYIINGNDFQTVKVVIQDICIRSFNRLCCPDVTFCLNRVLVLIYASRIFKDIFFAVFIFFFYEFDFISGISLFYIHSADIVVGSSFNHKTFICMVLCVTGKFDFQCIKEGHGCSRNISVGIVCGLKGLRHETISGKYLALIGYLNVFSSILSFYQIFQSTLLPSIP